jgi:hypothetical protein
MPRARLAAWLVGAIALLVPAEAFGTEARVEALQGDPMRPDESDVYRFPGLASTYADTVLLDFSPSPLDGHGTVLVNRPWTIGLSVHRPREWDDAKAEADIYGWGGDMPPVHPIADLLLGAGFARHGIGLRVGMSAGMGSTARSDALGGETSLSVMAIDTALGHSLDLPWYREDTAVGLTFQVLERTVASKVTAESDAMPSFVVSHRSLIGPERGLRLGVDLALTRRWYGLSLPETQGGQGSTMARWHVRGAVGPQADILPGVVLSGAIAFGHERLGGKVGDQDQDSVSGVVAPGLLASVEAEVVSWLVARAGLAYDLVHEQRTTRKNGAAVERQASMQHQFKWSLGLGLRWDPVRIDAMVAPGLLFQGPSMVGGGDPGMLTELSGAVEF